MTTALIDSPTAVSASGATESIRSVIKVPSHAVAAKNAPAAQTEPFGLWRSFGIGIVFLLLVGVALLVVNQFLPDDQFGKLKAAAAGGSTAAGTLSMFATFYVAAQAIERLLEPLSNVLVSKDGAESASASKVDSAGKKANELAEAASDATPNLALVNTAKQAVESSLKAVATAKNHLDLISQARTTLFWALATIAGMAVSASLKLYFLIMVGIGPGPRWMEVLATGLIIGAGTKPLHDLITTISNKKDLAAGAKTG
jgi:hypothetical protein